MNNMTDEDHSFPTPEMELIWRLEGLIERRNELNEKGVGCQAELKPLPEEVRYILPEHLYSIWDVERAIEYAKEDLEEQNGVIVDEGVSVSGEFWVQGCPQED